MFNLQAHTGYFPMVNLRFIPKSLINQPYTKTVYFLLQQWMDDVFPTRYDYDLIKFKYLINNLKMSSLYFKNRGFIHYIEIRNI